MKVIGKQEETFEIRTKEDKWEEMKRFRAKVLDSPFKFDGHWYYSEGDSKVELLSLKLRAIERKIDGLPLNVPMEMDGAPIYIKTVDNGYMQIYYNKVIDLANALESRTRLVYAVMAQHRALMIASSDFKTYDYKTGMPQMYHGKEHLDPD